MSKLLNHNIKRVKQVITGILSGSLSFDKLVTQRRYHTEVELVVGTSDVRVPTFFPAGLQKNDKLRMLGKCLEAFTPPNTSSKWRHYEECRPLI